MFPIRDADSSPFSIKDYELNSMLKVVRAERDRHAEILESLLSDLDTLETVIDFLQTIKDLEPYDKVCDCLTLPVVYDTIYNYCPQCGKKLGEMK